MRLGQPDSKKVLLEGRRWDVAGYRRPRRMLLAGASLPPPLWPLEKGCRRDTHAGISIGFGEVSRGVGKTGKYQCSGGASI
jgi:hypothetical protein